MPRRAGPYLCQAVGAPTPGFTGCCSDVYWGLLEALVFLPKARWLQVCSAWCETMPPKNGKVVFEPGSEAVAVARELASEESLHAVTLPGIA